MEGAPFAATWWRLLAVPCPYALWDAACHRIEAVPLAACQTLADGRDGGARSSACRYHCFRPQQVRPTHLTQLSCTSPSSVSRDKLEDGSIEP